MPELFLEIRGRIRTAADAVREAGACDELTLPALREAAIGALFVQSAESPVEGPDLGHRLGAVAKQIRLAGVWPVYMAALLADWLMRQPGTARDTIKSDAERLLGLHFERELLADIAGAAARLPALPDPIRTRLQKDAYARGYYDEKLYRGCAQCTLAATGDVTGRFDPVLFRAANGFAGGMAAMGDGVCGGYSGGVMSMGLFAGRRREFFDGDKLEKDQAAKMATLLRQKFIDTYGTVICGGIHKGIFGRSYTIADPADKDAFEEAGAHYLDKCPAVVGQASAWVVGILYDEGLLEEDSL